MLWIGFLSFTQAVGCDLSSSAANISLSTEMVEFVAVLEYEQIDHRSPVITNNPLFHWPKLELDLSHFTTNQ